MAGGDHARCRRGAAPTRRSALRSPEASTPRVIGVVGFRCPESPLDVPSEATLAYPANGCNSPMEPVGRGGCPDGARACRRFDDPPESEWGVSLKVAAA